MKCPRCQQDNPPQAKFCLECATPLALRCASCGTQLPSGAKFCFECANPVSGLHSTPRLVTPDSYTPKYLAERILNSKAALEGERKQVTVLFADLKGSMELLADRDRLFWVALARVWAGWRQPLVIVTPDTILRWQRRRFREHWTKLSGRPTRGRPPVNLEIAALVTRMAAANPLWGAPRIHGELLKLGFHVAERTVSRLIPKRRTPPSQTWRTFLTNHVPDLVSLDFFTVPTARLRVLNFNVTEHPSATWTAQQIVDAFPDDSAPSYLLRDRDSIYGHAFRQRVKGMGISEV